jgi:hypothetical protein
MAVYYYSYMSSLVVYSLCRGVPDLPLVASTGSSECANTDVQYNRLPQIVGGKVCTLKVGLASAVQLEDSCSIRTRKSLALLAAL